MTNLWYRTPIDNSQNLNDNLALFFFNDAIRGGGNNNPFPNPQMLRNFHFYQSALQIDNCACLIETYHARVWLIDVISFVSINLAKLCNMIYKVSPSL